MLTAAASWPRRAHDAGKLADAQADGAREVLTRMQGNFCEAAALINDWAQRGAGFFGTLKQALAGRRFSEAFDRLRGELAERLADAARAAGA